jgi:hypothetical protein
MPRPNRQVVNSAIVVFATFHKLANRPFAYPFFPHLQLTKWQERIAAHIDSRDQIEGDRETTAYIRAVSQTGQRDSPWRRQTEGLIGNLNWQSTCIHGPRYLQ